MHALSKSMIKAFQNDQRPSYVPDAAKLSSVATEKDYEDLVEAFANAIITGTADGNILRPTLLLGFSQVLRHAGDIKWARNALGPVIGSLQSRLKSAVEQAGLDNQYHLICALSVVLDAMVDNRISGLDREQLHEPLLEQLKALSTHEELRLAQAANYAYQALLGVPDNEERYEKILRHTIALVESASNVAGAVSTMDPTRIIDAIRDLGDVPDLINSTIAMIKSLYGAYNGLGSLVEGMSRQQAWYAALRYADMLIRADAFGMLEIFIQQVPCHQDKEFLCGLFSLLEQAWETRNMKDQIIDFLRRNLIQKLPPHRRVREWGKLVANTLNQPNWQKTLEDVPWRFVLLNKLRREYKSSLPTLPRTNIGPLSRELLEEAWSKCEEAQMSYADARIHEYYTEREEERLKIERLSGDRLRMDQCYINLAVVGHSGERNTENQSSPILLFDRLKVKGPIKEMQVSLPELFSPRKRPDGTTAPPPRRVLIRGRAGVGKTTLCKKIVHDYIHKNMWAESFDRLLWMPLRKLKEGSESSYNLGNLLHDEYLSQHEEGELLARALWNATKSSRTLFVLDGLDEVYRKWDPETATEKLLQNLLSQPNVIITSRPYGLSLANIDLELETIGFYPDQVQAYVNIIARDPENPRKVKDIQSFIQGQALIQGLVQIPIQLDAVCYSWDRGFRSGNMPKTMTKLYQAIVVQLWRKDILPLRKQRNGVPLKGGDIPDLDDWEIETLVQDESELLEFLAFTGIYNDIIEFNDAHRSEICKHLTAKRADTPIYRKALRLLSFLRTSDCTLADSKRSYHFLHLTFQEFFAARHFARHWDTPNKLLCVKLSSDTTEIKVTPQEFLQERKYNSRYDIVWRFVSGLLRLDKLHSFFQMLEAEPRDLLGPAHQRLLMHCFSEVAPSGKEPSLDRLRADTESKLSQWLLFECNVSEYPQFGLGSEMECPDHTLIDLLQRCEAVKRYVLTALRGRPRIPSDALSLVASWLKQDVSKDLKIATFETLLHHRKFLPAEISQSLVLLLRDKDEDVRSHAAIALSWQSDLPLEIFQALVLLLKDKDKGARYAANALRRQSTLPAEISQSLVLLLRDKDEDVRSHAANVLSLQSDLPLEILQALALLLKDEDKGVMVHAADALNGQSTLPQEILQALVLLLKDKDKDARSHAANALGRQSTLPQGILQALASLMKGEDKVVRSHAADALRRQSDLPQEILQVLASLLKDEDKGVIAHAAYTLEGQSTLPQGILQALVLLLKDKDEDVRSHAANALGRQSTLPQEILQVLASLLKDEDKGVMVHAADALNGQSTLPQEILQALVLLLKDKDKDVRLHATNTLERQSTLPQGILQALASLIKGEDKVVRSHAADALRRQSDLPLEILQVLASLLKGKDQELRSRVAYALRNQSTLPKDILQALVLLLKDKDKVIRSHTANTLRRQSTLPPEILQALTSLLKDTDWDVRFHTATTLRGKSTLQGEFLQVLVLLLKDKDQAIRSQAIYMSGEQLILPLEILQALVLLLKDKDKTIRSCAANTLRRQSTLPTEILQALTSLLKDTDRNVRFHTATTLREKSTLPEEILQVLASLLEGEDQDMRLCTTLVLSEQSDLPQEILQALVLLLKDKDKAVRSRAANTLRRQSTLLQRILQALALLLQDESKVASNHAEEILRHHGGFYSILPKLNARCWKGLYLVWVRKSFSEHMSCYLWRGCLYIDISGQLSAVSFTDEDQDMFKSAIQEEQAVLGIPSHLISTLKV